jgi:hypothetical protein
MFNVHIDCENYVASLDDETIGMEQWWNGNEGVNRTGTKPVAVPDPQEQK